MKKFCCMLVAVGVAAAMGLPAGAQDVESNILLAANIYGTTEGNVYLTTTAKSQAADSKHGVSYGRINWTAQISTAGEQWRIANESELTPDLYERYAHWGGGSGRDPFRFTRGVVRYDTDSWVTLGTQPGVTVNMNGVFPPMLFQLEYRPDWYGPEGTPLLMETDNQWAWFGADVNNQIQAGPAPFRPVYQWGPGPPAAGATEVDWCFTGGGLTGKLQIACSDFISAEWSWNDDPVNPLLPYYALDVDMNYKYVDNVWGHRDSIGGPAARGDLYTQDALGHPGARANSPILDLEMYYGETENAMYCSQNHGRIYKVIGVKDLGYRRRVGQPGAGERVTGVNGSDAIYTPGTNLYAAPYDSGNPIIGDAPADHQNPGPNGVGITGVELFSDLYGQRRYVGLAVDAGQRVYAVSSRIVEGGAEVGPIYRSITGDVWGDDPVDPNSLSDVNASFASPANDNDVVVILGGTNANVGSYLIASVVSATKVTLDGDPGDSGGAADVDYKIYENGQNPLPAQLKVQGTDGNVDRTVLLENGNAGAVANGGGIGPFTLTDVAKDFVTAGVAVDDNVAIVPSSVGGDPGTYNITAVAATVLTLESDAGDTALVTNVTYEVFKDSQAVISSDIDADVATAQLDDADALFLTDGVAANDLLAIISGTGVNAGIYTISMVTSETQILVQGTDNMGNSGGAGDVVYEVLDGEAEFQFSDTTKDFVTAGVKYGDLLEMDYDGDPNAPNWNSARRIIREVSTTSVTVSADLGDTYGLGQGGKGYNIYEAGSPDWTAEALVDVFLPDGTLDATIDLNDLLRPDGTKMATSMLSAQGGNPPAAVKGFLVSGDIEIAPDATYATGEEPGADVTRLWIAGYGGEDNSPDGDDGLDLLVIDVAITPSGDDQGKVASASYFGGIDDGELMSGDWYAGNFNVTGFEPYNMWLMFNDFEFDGLGNMVYAGGRGGNDNRYSAVDATQLALSVGNMILEQNAAPPEDAVVGTTGFFLDMNYFGFNTDFGISFDNTPLTNNGCATKLPPDLELVSTDPPAEGTLPRDHNNEIDFVFSAAPPVVAQPLVVTHLAAGCADVSTSFTYTVVGNTLYAKENGQQLIHTNWYRFEPHPTLGSAAFQVDLAVVWGDADRSAQVLAFDYFEVKNNMFYSPAHMSDNCAATPPQTANCGRADLDGSGQVLAFDYFVVKNNMFAVPGAKGVCP